jgi:hypothetical protein
MAINQTVSNCCNFACKALITGHVSDKYEGRSAERNKLIMKISLIWAAALLTISMAYVAISALACGNLPAHITNSIYYFMGGIALFLILGCIFRCLYFRELDSDKLSKRG